MTSDDLAERLGALIRQRRKALRLTQADVQEAGGPSTATLRLIEGGKHTDFRPSTSGPLETILQWQPGSIQNVLDGKDPTTIPQASANLSGSGSLTATAVASGSGHVVVHPGPAHLVRLDNVPLLELVDEVRRRVVSLVAPPSDIDDVTRGFATIQDAVKDEKDRTGLGDGPGHRGDGVKRRGHSPPNV